MHRQYLVNYSDEIARKLITKGRRGIYFVIISHRDYYREVLILKDGGQLALDWVEIDIDPKSTDTKRSHLLVLVHGITSTLHEGSVRSLSNVARNLGYR